MITGFGKNSLKELFAEGRNKDYCVMIVDHREHNGAPTDSVRMKEIKEAYDNMLNASLISFYSETFDNIIISYLNYNSKNFSVRALAGSLRQIMYTLSPESLPFLYYSEAFPDEASIESEKNFLLTSLGYGALIGFYMPIRSDFLKKCTISDYKLSRHILTDIYQYLVNRDYDKVESVINEDSIRFNDFSRNEECYNRLDLLQYSADFYAALKLFFTTEKYAYSCFEKDLTTLLYENNGCAGLLHVFLESVKLYRHNFEVPSTDKEVQFIKDVKSYLDDHLATAGLSDAAGHFGVTSSYLCRLFKKNTGLNITEYITDKRFDLAMEMLQKRQDLTIAEIGTQLGYKSQSHFQTIFKKKYGVSPDAYRRSYLANKPR